MYEHRCETLLQNSQDDSETARILSVSSPSASDWLHMSRDSQVGLERGQAEEHVQAVRAAGAGEAGQDRPGEQVSRGTGGDHDI